MMDGHGVLQGDLAIASVGLQFGDAKDIDAAVIESAWAREDLKHAAGLVFYGHR